MSELEKCSAIVPSGFPFNREPHRCNTANIAMEPEGNHSIWRKASELPTEQFLELLGGGVVSYPLEADV